MNKVRLVFIYLFVALSYPISVSTYAALTEGDWLTPGDGLLTIDESTGLKWLDLTATINRSFNDVSTQFGPGGDFEEFRYATNDEVINFFSSAGIVDLSENWNADNYQPALALQALIGVPWSAPHTSGGTTGDQSPYANYHEYGAIQSNMFPNSTVFEHSRVGFGRAPLHDDESTDFFGNWLVKESTPDELIAELVNTVIAMNLQQGISNALDHKLNNLLMALEDANTSNDVSAVNTLYSFIYSVEAQRGKHLTDQQAETLITAAQSVINILSE
jgi:hypothetical protein